MGVIIGEKIRDIPKRFINIVLYIKYTTNAIYIQICKIQNYQAYFEAICLQLEPTFIIETKNQTWKSFVKFCDVIVNGLSK